MNTEFRLLYYTKLHVHQFQKHVALLTPAAFDSTTGYIIFYRGREA